MLIATFSQLLEDDSRLVKYFGCLQCLSSLLFSFRPGIYICDALLMWYVVRQSYRWKSRTHVVALASHHLCSFRREGLLGLMGARKPGCCAKLGARGRRAGRAPEPPLQPKKRSPTRPRSSLYKSVVVAAADRNAALHLASINAPFAQAIFFWTISIKLRLTTHHVLDLT